MNEDIPPIEGDEGDEATSSSGDDDKDEEGEENERSAASANEEDDDERKPAVQETEEEEEQPLEEGASPPKKRRRSEASTAVTLQEKWDEMFNRLVSFKVRSVQRRECNLFLCWRGTCGKAYPAPFELDCCTRW